MDLVIIVASRNFLDGLSRYFFEADRVLRQQRLLGDALRFAAATPTLYEVSTLVADRVVLVVAVIIQTRAIETIFHLYFWHTSRR